MNASLRNKIFEIKNPDEFWETTLEVYNYQLDKNIVYRDFINALGRGQRRIKTFSDIPFLPIEFFKNKKVVTGERTVEMVFESSGTTGVVPGKHFVYDLGLYEKSFLKAFTIFYGDPAEYLIAALLPSYTDREGSSLVYMVNKLISKSQNPLSGFYKESMNDLLPVIATERKRNQKILLLGVSFALIDLAEKFSADLSGIFIMETGGMKGRRKELTRGELHSILKKKFNVLSIHSEYGMTELMSQAYSARDGIFYCPPWMKVVIRDPHDPLSLISEPGRTGGINIIDLANIYSCSFIETGDLGKLHEDGGFEVLGRLDNNDIRGCNLLVQ